MSYRNGALALLTLATALTAACATTGYHVSVNALLAPQVASIPPGSSVHVWTGEEDRNDLLRLEVAHKIECLLGSAGYVVSDLVSSDYVITFEFGIGQHDEAYTKSVYQPTGQVGKNFAEGFAIGLASHKSVESVRTVNDRWFWAQALDVRSWNEGEEPRAVWSCETTSSGSSADLRDVLNYMLVPSFERFGASTEAAEESILREGDRGVVSLRANCR